MSKRFALCARENEMRTSKRFALCVYTCENENERGGETGDELKESSV